MSRANISAVAIRHPIPPIVLFIVLVFAGLVAFWMLPVNNNPDVDFPIVTVEVSQPGAAPVELETQVARKIEDALVGIEGIDHVRTTIEDGDSLTFVEFRIGYNTDRAVNDVRDAVSRIRSQLPQDIYEPRVQRQSFTTEIMYYSVASDSLTMEQLSWLIDNDLTQVLMRVPGVGQVTRLGGVTREVRINLDPNRLIAMGVTADEVNQQMRALNVDLPGGRGNLGASEQSIRTLGAQRTIEDLRRTEIAIPGGRRVRLADLGEVTDGTSEMRQIMRLDGEPAVGVDILRAPNASEVATGRGVEAAIKNFAETHHEMRFRQLFSLIDFTKSSFKASTEALILGAILAVAVVWLFLRDLRATWISAFAMPLSIIPTFLALQAIGFTLNFITMLALSLVVGILVDDAIVEIENIVRHIRMGKRPYDAALEAADEIGLAVVATTMAIVVVFVPVSFMPGYAGQYFDSFGITVAVAVLFSLMVARLITPMMAAYLLKPAVEEHRPGPWTARYRRLLEFTMSSLWHRIGAMAAASAIFALSIALAAFIPTSFMPKEDIGFSRVSVELPPGATLAEMDATLQKLASILSKEPDVENVFERAGRSNQPRIGEIWALLKPRALRETTQQAFEARVLPRLLEVPGARIAFLANGFSNRDISIILTGEDADKLEAHADKVMAEMKELPYLVNVSSTAATLRPEIVIKPDSDRAAEQGVSAAAIGQVAKIATLGDIDTNSAKFTIGDRQIPIRVQIDPEFRSDLDAIEDLRVRNVHGEMIPLRSVAEITLGSGAVQIERFDRARRVTINADLKGKEFGDANKAINALPAMAHLPPGISNPPYGDAEQMAILFKGFTIALSAAVLLIVAVLILLFRNFFQPVTILMALPLSVGGAIAALLICGRSLSLPAMIGFLMLMGIVSKNSILLVEYAIVSMRERGMNRKEALLDAGAKRARPIIMTSVAMIAGMSPIAVGWGANNEFQQPMAIAVIGGLVTSTALSLVFVPVIFTFVDDFQTWIVPKCARFLTHSSTAPAKRGIHVLDRDGIR